MQIFFKTHTDFQYTSSEEGCSPKILRQFLQKLIYGVSKDSIDNCLFEH